MTWAKATGPLGATRAVLRELEWGPVHLDSRACGEDLWGITPGFPGAEVLQEVAKCAELVLWRDASGPVNGQDLVKGVCTKVAMGYLGAYSKKVTRHCAGYV